MIVMVRDHDKRIHRSLLTMEHLKEREGKFDWHALNDSSNDRFSTLISGILKKRVTIPSIISTAWSDRNHSVAINPVQK
jgi:hypothetical protein